MSLSSVLQTGLFPHVIRWAPAFAGRALFRLTSGMYYLFVNVKERRLIRRNVKDMLRPTWRRNAESVTQDVFAGISDHYFEKLMLAAKPLSYLKRFFDRRVVLVRERILKQAVERGKGTLIVTAHWGAEELIPAILYLRGYPVTVILETSTPELRRRLERQTAGHDVELLFASDEGTILERILDTLKRGRILITQCDEVDAWRRRKSRTIELFGHTLYFDHTLDFIARMSGATVLALYNRRLPTLRYRLVCEEVAVDGALAQDVSKRSLNLWERYTLESPEQWHQWKKWALMKAM